MIGWFKLSGGMVVCCSMVLGACAGALQGGSETAPLQGGPETASRPGGSETAPLQGGAEIGMPQGGSKTTPLQGGSEVGDPEGGAEAVKIYPTAAVPPKTKNECEAAALGESVLLSQFGQGGSSHLLSAIDPLSGLALCDYAPITGGRNATVRLSPDRRTLAMVVSRKHDHSDGALHLVDLEKWQDVEITIAIRNWVSRLAFSPEGRYLAIAYMDPEANDANWPGTSVVDLVDLSSQQRVATRTLDLAPRVMEFSAYGKALMVYGVTNQVSSGIDARAYAVLLDASDLEVTWELALEGVADGQTRLYGSDGSETYAWWGPAAVLSAQQQALYIVHADEDKFTTVDFGRRTMKTVEIQPKMSWLERLLAQTAGVAHAKMVDGTTKQAVLSPDGERLYIVGQTNDTWQDDQGNWQFTQTPLGLQVVDVATGTEVAHLDTEGTEPALSHDGRRLFLRGWSLTTNWTEVVDLESLEIETRLTNRQLVPARRLNGEPVLLSARSNGGSQAALAAIDAETLEEMNRWWVPGYAEWVWE